MSDTRLADLRKSYELATLDEAQVASQPSQQFRAWFGEALAKQVMEPNAMTLATVGSNGRPSTRPVLIKELDERGLVWFSNYASRKGQELAENSCAALQFHWLELERVVRIEGIVERISAEESDQYFQTRPLSHRIGAWASPQSAELENRGVILARVAEYGLKFGLKPPCPPFWGGYRLIPDYWEFWQGRKSRLHDRVVFRLGGDGHWQCGRLAP